MSYLVLFDEDAFVSEYRQVLLLRAADSVEHQRKGENQPLTLLYGRCTSGGRRKNYCTRGTIDKLSGVCHPGAPSEAERLDIRVCPRHPVRSLHAKYVPACDETALQLYSRSPLPLPPSSPPTPFAAWLDARCSARIVNHESCEASLDLTETRSLELRARPRCARFFIHTSQRGVVVM